MAKDHCVASPELKNAKRPRNLQIPLFLPNSPVGTANPGQAFRICPDLFIELNQSSDQSIRTDCEMVKCLLFPFVFYKKNHPVSTMLPSPLLHLLELPDYSRDYIDLWQQNFVEIETKI